MSHGRKIELFKGWSSVLCWNCNHNLITVCTEHTLWVFKSISIPGWQFTPRNQFLHVGIKIHTGTPSNLTPCFTGCTSVFPWHSFTAVHMFVILWKGTSSFPRGSLCPADLGKPQWWWHTVLLTAGSPQLSRSDDRLIVKWVRFYQQQEWERKHRGKEEKLKLK